MPRGSGINLTSQPSRKVSRGCEGLSRRGSSRRSERGSGRDPDGRLSGRRDFGDAPALRSPSRGRCGLDGLRGLVSRRPSRLSEKRDPLSLDSNDLSESANRANFSIEEVSFTQAG